MRRAATIPSRLRVPLNQPIAIGDVRITPLKVERTDAGDLALHPFGQMMERRLSAALCTDNRLVSNTTLSNEVRRAVVTFDLELNQLQDVLTYGFKRSFFPGRYLEKRAYVRQVLDVMHRVVQEWQAGELPGGAA